MHVTQPAASQRLANLQARLGFDLFERRSGVMQPTAAGERLVRAADAVDLELTAALTDARNIVAKRSRRLRIATQCYTCYRWLPFVIRDMHRIHPELEVDVVPEATDAPYDALKANSVDIAIVSNPGAGSPMDEHSLFTDELYAIVSNNHPLANRRYLNPANFIDQNLILYTGKKHAVLEEVLFPADVRPARVTQVRITEAIVELARSGQGIAVIAGWAFDDFGNTDGLRAVRITRRGFKRTWRAVIGPSCDLLQAETFIDSVRTIGKIIQRTGWRPDAQRSAGRVSSVRGRT